MKKSFDRILDCIDSCTNEEQVENCSIMADLFLQLYNKGHDHSMICGAIIFKKRLLENQLKKTQYPIVKTFGTVILPPLN